ncbi:MAG: hypothetical protein Q8P18_17000 [Pseudomonadota bacterium]|nr:hypothetical protein [Pseudomonadota bacterium]
MNLGALLLGACVLGLGACTPAPAVVPSALPVTVGGPPPPYGFWGMNGHLSPAGLDDLSKRFRLTIFQTATADPSWAVHTLLPMARASGVKVTLRTTADHSAYTTNGDFDLDAWKARLAPWAGSGVQAFIDDGTLVGHMLLDDIANFDRRDPDAADLDEMARYSKELLPGLMTYVRQKASAMPIPGDTSGGRYVYLDACVNQYKSAEGSVTSYAASEAAQARRLGLGIINGLNIANGGDGSSGQPGWGAGRHAMSASEITDYGTVLSAVPECGMFLNWEYDGEERWSDGTVGSAYFNRPDLQAALAGLGARVADHRPVPLLKPPVKPPPLAQPEMLP